MPKATRRRLLAATALVDPSSAALARSVTGGLSWSPNEVNPPPVTNPGPFLFFTAEGAVVGAIADRLIPTDALYQISLIRTYLKERHC